MRAPSIVIDENLLARLPLPLAQLYRRAHNAKSPRDRRDFAYYIWEAALKLLASTALVAYAEQPDDAEVNRKLPDLEAPSLGQWKDLVLLLVPALARRGDESFRKIADLLTQSRDDLPRCTHLQSTILTLLNHAGSGRTTICLRDFLPTLVEYRNKEFSHGAPASRGDEAIAHQANALAAAAVELFDRLDVLAGRKLIAITDVNLSDGAVRAARVNLIGLNPWQIDPLEWPLGDHAARPPDAGVYLADPQHQHDPAGLRSLHPLVVFDPVGESVLLYNGRTGRNNALHLCYVTNRMPKLNLAAGVNKDLLAKLLDLPVAEPDAEPLPAMRSPTETDKPLGPRFIGDYELKRELGRGAMGVVYEAWQPVLRRRVALKEQPRSHDPLADKRFLREIAALGRVEHPNLIKVFTSGSEGGCLYYTMELIEGSPLSAESDALTHGGSAPTAFNDQPAPVKPSPVAALAASSTKGDNAEYVERIVRLIKQTAEAAHALHEAGVLHRDIKPGNIMVTADGSRAVLMDLGTARMTNETSTLTKQFLGTLRYASLEQLRGMTLDARSDVYSLGATLWELLALKPMFQVSEQTPTPDLIHKLEREEPERLTRLNPAVPRNLESVVHKCLEKKPESRYATAKDFADDLDRWLQSGNVRARPVRKLDRAIKWARRHPAIAALYAAIAALVVLMVASIIVHQRQQIVHAAAERQTRANATIEALESADIAGVPIIIHSLDSVRSEANPILRERYQAASPGSPQRLRYALALLPVDPKLADEVLSFARSASGDEVLVLRSALRDYPDKVAALWPAASAPAGDFNLSVAGLLAGFAPDDARWKDRAAGVAGNLVRLSPIELRVWSNVFDPIHRTLTPPLVNVYEQAQARLRSSDPSLTDLIQSASRLDIAAVLLTRYAADQSDVLGDLLQIADDRHFASFLEPARLHEASIKLALKTAVERRLPADASDAALDANALRQANAAATLLLFGEPSPAWAMLKHTPDPTARSYLIHGLPPHNVQRAALIARYETEADISARRALLHSLGNFRTVSEPLPQEPAFRDRLLREFREHPDPGLHSAIDWFLRWSPQYAGELDRIASELRGQQPGERNWHISPSGQPFAVIRGPVEFTMGSPPDEPGREEGPVEVQYRKTIPRSYAIAMHEVTAAEFLRMNPKHRYRKQYSPASDSPIVDVAWYHAIAYCRWLSEQEGVPEDQMCYPPLAQITPDKEIVMPADFLNRTGYRLPTEAEWEFACRAGAVTTRPYGRGIGLLGRYTWYQVNSDDHAWPVASLKPNDLGLFDILGNGGEWCHQRYSFDRKPVDDDALLRVPPGNVPIVARGGSWYLGYRASRSASRYALTPATFLNFLGFRVVRTVK